MNVKKITIEITQEGNPGPLNFFIAAEPRFAADKPTKEEMLFVLKSATNIIENNAQTDPHHVNG